MGNNSEREPIPEGNSVGLTSNFQPSEPWDGNGAAAPIGTTVLANLQQPENPFDASDAQPSWPVRIGRYVLEGEIARGGMGIIYRAKDLTLGREVAMKALLARQREDVRFRNRFVEEARIAAGLQHPGITPVYDIGELPDGRPFFTMRVVHGRTLADLLATHTQESLARPHLLNVFEKVCQTMAYSHSRQVIHRDLKPANVMVSSFGVVKVMDWGVAKVMNGCAHTERPQDENPLAIPAEEIERPMPAGSSTLAGSIFGTPAYMPPEQAAGRHDLVDERADVFGLGAVLCEILTGFPPYLQKKSSTVFQQAQTADLSDAYDRAQLPRPWKYYNDRCYRTVKNLRPDVPMIRGGTHHNALDDAKSQATHLMAIQGNS